MHKYQTLFILIALSYVAHSQDRRDDVLFQNIGTYSVGSIEKVLWVPRHFKAQWYEARALCQAHGFDILTIGTLDEFTNVTQACKENIELFGQYVHIGGAATVAKSPNEWYWITNHEKISYDAPWGTGQPDNNNEFCLALSRDNEFQFHDIACQGEEEKFICQRIRCYGLRDFEKYCKHQRY